jgi:sporulation protein YqfC
MGVYEYRDTYLKLKLNKGAVIICGSDFDITQFENRLITIKGIISSVEFNI